MKQICKSALLLCLLIILSGLNCKDQSFKQTDIALVNNEPITKPEFELIIDKNRKEVIEYFTNKYDSQYDNNFWTTDFENEQPLDILKKRALAECVKIKIQQMIARDNGIIRDISYPSLLAELNKVNKKRRQAGQAKRIIYESLEFNVQNFLYYQLDKIIIELKETLVNDVFDVSEPELKKFYHNHKDELFKEIEYIKIRKISIPVKAVEKSEILTRHEEAITRLSEIKHSLEQNLNLSLLLSPDVEIQEYEFDESTTVIDEKLNYKLKEIALGLLPGNVSEIYDQDTGPFIIKCLARRDGYYFPYEQVTEIVRANYIDYCYNNYIDEHIQKASIKINKSVYQSVIIPF